MLIRGIATIMAIVTTHSAAAGTQDHPAIIPQPAQIQRTDGEFPISKLRAVEFNHSDADVQPVAEYLASWLSDATRRTIPVSQSAGHPASGTITLNRTNANASLGDEGYELRVTTDAIRLSAPTPRGLFYAVQTLRQLLPPKPNATPNATLPCLAIKDQPRYRWRGMLLDCCRHFMTKEFVKRYIDLLAFHKMNVLHWHLTEDQGWRIEIKKYPRLTEVAAWRDEGGQRYGGFYTQEDIKEVVAYAASRFVTVVPEIEMPGHSVAALAAYPHLSCTGGPHEVANRWGVFHDVYCAGNDQVFDFLQDVLDEVIELFPSPYIHIGGDECPKKRWETCAKCQARIKTEGLQDEHELQSYFIRRIENYLNTKNRRLIGWDEILEGGLAPNATVQSWRGMRGAVAAATSGHDVIASPTSHCYLDYAQMRLPGEPTNMGFIDLETSYSFEPTPPELTPSQAGHVLGLEGNIWTEHAPQERVDWQVFPRLTALSEVAWSPKELRDWPNFAKRMMAHYTRLDALGVKYFLAPPQCDSRHHVFTDTLDVALRNPLDRGTIHYTLDGSTPTSRSPRYVKPLTFSKTTIVRARTYLPNDRVTETSEFHLRKLEPLEPVTATRRAPGLHCKYYEGHWRRLPDFDPLSPAATGITDNFNMTLRKRTDAFGLTFTGRLEVPADGTYTFHLRSDDGSRLWIGSDLVVDHDGLHSVGNASGQVILKAGLHPITVHFFESGGSEHLTVSYEGPSIPKQPIPASVLWHKDE